MALPLTASGILQHGLAPTYSVNVAVIDEQHQTLIAQIRALQGSHSGRAGRRSPQPDSFQPPRLSPAHFMFEEGLWKRTLTPKMAAPQAAHAELAETAGGTPAAN